MRPFLSTLSCWHDSRCPAQFRGSTTFEPSAFVVRASVIRLEDFFVPGTRFRVMERCLDIPSAILDGSKGRRSSFAVLVLAGKAPRGRHTPSSSHRRTHWTSLVSTTGSDTLRSIDRALMSAR
ncbi:hypothetical protein, variant 1 [Aphanomyces astaci]|uniref:Uncharacterized protein n=1 Tax=Aphanomyces astaci TaxID=112090 RepID=W4FBV7_APHAT|nr:hypothetical protein, variant 1 [Aphanomyces astaci]ETV64404.1 hypothetical protein, variant 1 [Aphanomyces astaci]|eukprot:XP_009846095.1 hypothetical protein, variant 1 [Aphanomyces astaci]